MVTSRRVLAVRISMSGRFSRKKLPDGSDVMVIYYLFLCKDNMEGIKIKIRLATLTGGQPHQSFSDFIKFFVLQRYEKLFIIHGST